MLLSSLQRCFCVTALLLLLLLVLSLADVLVAAGTCIIRGACRVARAIYCLSNLHLLLAEDLCLLFQGLDIWLVPAKLLSDVLQRLLDALLHLVAQFIFILVKALFSGVHESIRLILHLNHLFALLVSLYVCLSIAHHLLDLILAETTGRLDNDVLFFARCLILCSNVDDAICVDIERYLDLRDTARCWRDTDKVELAKHLVLLRHFTLTLQHLNLHFVLVVGSSREGLRLLGRDCRVPGDQAREDTSKRLDSKGQWRDIKQENILHVALQHTTLDGGTHCDDFIWVDALAGRLSEKVLHNSLDLRHAAHASDEENLVDVALLNAGVLNTFAARSECALHELVHDALKLGLRERDIEMLWPGAVCGDVWKLHLCLLEPIQVTLRLLRGLAKTLRGELVLRQVNGRLLLELVDEMVQ